MIETFNRQQVDNIVAPWLNLCKEQEERIAELRLEIVAATGQAQTALEENAKLREAAQAVVDAREADLIRADGCLPTTAQSKAIDALAQHLEVTK